MRAVFLDRDGVICKNRSDYVKNWQEFEFLPGVLDSLAELSNLDLPIIIVTNQSAIGRNITSTRAVEDIHNKMIAEIVRHGGRIDQVLYCPHRPDENCNCRKPQPGMLLQASREMKLDLLHSYMVGDATTDLIAGQKVGCLTYLVLTGRGKEQLVSAFRSVNSPFSIVRNLQSAINQIVRTEWHLTGTGAAGLKFSSELDWPMLPVANKLA